MVLLATSTGIFASGCPHPGTVPPRSFPQHPAVAPPRGLQPRPLQPAPPGRPRQNQTRNPWQPDAEPRDWRYIVLHHTATNRGSVESIHATHRKRKDSNGKKWLGIGYHFVIGNGNGMGDGEIESTFRWRTQIHGAHAGKREYNERGVGIVLVGNFEEAKPTAAQLASVKRLVSTLKREYRISAKDVVGHGDVRATACPGKFFPLAEVSRSEPYDLQFGLLPETTTIIR